MSTLELNIMNLAIWILEQLPTQSSATKFAIFMKFFTLFKHMILELDELQYNLPQQYMDARVTNSEFALAYKNAL
jgi:glycyl-tRNA synthetase beta subunit